MDRLRDRRAILDRSALHESALAVVEGDYSESDRGPALLELYREALEAGWAEVRRRFEEDQKGGLAVAGHCFLMDQLIRVIYDIAAERLYPAANPTRAELLSIVAFGGYGRGELAPKSDVDLLFLTDYKLTARVEQLVEYILYTLWDLGLKVGHATRSIDECVSHAKADMTIRTGLLEARYVWGEQSLFHELRARFQSSVVQGTGPDFVDAKLRERDERHQRMGDSRYLLEPNIKDGKGGLRDLQTLFWIAKYLYGVSDVSRLVDEGVFTRREVRRFAKAQEFLWTVRCWLHYLSGRAEERLTFDLQPELARCMGYRDSAGAPGVERFMRHYFLYAKDVGDLTRIFCAALEARHQRRRLLRLPLGLFNREAEGFAIEGGRLTVENERQFAERPVDMLRLFEVAHRRDLEIHPEALHLITRDLRRIDNDVREDPEANRIFRAILTAHDNPEVTLRRMNEAGVLGRFITDFGRVVAQMQFDMYHIYTTDEHTIRAIGTINRIERGELADDHPLSTKIIHQALSRDVLYAAVLLHDIAKGRGGDHSVIGAEIARRLCPRFGFTSAQTETISWLVLHHLAMSNTAFKRDLADTKAIHDFVELVQSPERLRLLLCLTVADIRAVGPGRWNQWKATLLRELYYRAEAVMTGRHTRAGREERAAGVTEILRERLSDWPREAVDDHIARGHAAYWLSFDIDSLERQARFVRASEESGRPLSVDERVDAERAVTEVTVYMADHPGLFSRIAGALALSGANIVDANINTLNNGMALDSFLVQDSERTEFDNVAKLSRMKRTIEQTLAGEIDPIVELRKRRGLPRRKRILAMAPRVLIDNKASNRHTLVEINANDRSGLLYAVTRALSDLNLQVYSAKISTYGEEVVDVFYVKDLFGMKVEHPGKLEQIRKGLLEALGAPELQPTETEFVAAAQ